MNIGNEVGRIIRLFQTGKINEAIAAIVAVIALLFGGAQAPAPQPAPSQPVAQAPAQQGGITQAQMLNELNAFRARNGRAPLRSHGALNSVAQGWSATMSRQQRLYHNPSYSQSYPMGWRMAGENVLMNGRRNVTARDLINQWANSPGHRANMLRAEFTHVGHGITRDSSGKVWAVQNFAAY